MAAHAATRPRMPEWKLNGSAKQLRRLGGGGALAPLWAWAERLAWDLGERPENDERRVGTAAEIWRCARLWLLPGCGHASAAAGLHVATRIDDETSLPLLISNRRRERNGRGQALGANSGSIFFRYTIGFILDRTTASDAARTRHQVAFPPSVGVASTNHHLRICL